MDANWRWAHVIDDYVNCYSGNAWDSSYCPNGPTCTSNCAIDGVDKASWGGTYGVTSDSDGIRLVFVTAGPYSNNIGSRVYLMDTDDLNYRMFKLKNREFTFDVDVSGFGCGLNAAVYFVEMDRDGGYAEYSGNEVGANFGTGYCDAQCPHDVKWVAGEANCNNWKPSPTDQNSGAGQYGCCCYEMDIFEANNMAASYTPHDCAITGFHKCEGTECGDNDSGERYDGVCDKDGCDWAAYRLNQKDFYGPGSQYTVDTTKAFTIVTQFITSDGTDSGELVEIRRKYVQNGQVIENPPTNFMEMGIPPYDSVTMDYCNDIKTYFGDINDFELKGGLKAMGDALDRGLVLTMSVWDDHFAYMLWLDGQYPVDVPADTPGVMRGPCPTDSGRPADLEANVPNSAVRYFNIKYGPIDSTYPH
ncbi:unnamed protein product [Meganyctiphanes norvegica]|uniref:cellulose 1,4-beta-cellobiosidase (non-reducing end) n=1 Tax=Meganyctiphanes norvegica TaxID=48144 RepID=A0AAV2RX88_MEGNR